VPCSMQLDKERNATSTPEGQAGVLVVHKHHLLVRCSHRLNVPILLGLILSGVSILLGNLRSSGPDPLKLEKGRSESRYRHQVLAAPYLPLDWAACGYQYC